MCEFSISWKIVWQDHGWWVVGSACHVGNLTSWGSGYRVSVGFVFPRRLSSIWDKCCQWNEVETILLKKGDCSKVIHSAGTFIPFMLFFLGARENFLLFNFSFQYSNTQWKSVSLKQCGPHRYVKHSPALNHQSTYNTWDILIKGQWMCFTIFFFFFSNRGKQSKDSSYRYELCCSNK